MAGRIHRVTMFKIVDEGQQKQLIDQYKVMQSAEKDGKPYIHNLIVGLAAEDPRAQGFTVVSKSEFASLEDMKFYDEGCTAHAALKAYAKENITVSGFMSVYFEPSFIANSV
ncbi:stress responsive A/B Barrel domain-containing protein [Colletotrichum graminicola]|uniref:Stress responsive A/B Barrel domain-containing protein n=1 Tax=Colletotrichum graminicola (strain M1.001 / M2 / FGSC 10212) TaxID=645133 RepID=E3Q7B0_COLGM|nr:stress responsive A/B Barrel domain-containing protein [Colletotrichum graminicola M1.001]EFQ26748.1 stress responsive A/B Barrel domain-containing protein [Colletotrichum graminicola M1.001]WDK17702.1 stress responsive A/B Barrel domain-containing protein [Colletotrichum graminicola]